MFQPHGKDWQLLFTRFATDYKADFVSVADPFTFSDVAVPSVINNNIFGFGFTQYRRIRTEANSFRVFGRTQCSWARRWSISAKNGIPNVCNESKILRALSLLSQLLYSLRYGAMRRLCRCLCKFTPCKFTPKLDKQKSNWHVRT